MKIAILGTSYEQRYDRSLVDVIEILLRNGVDIFIEESFRRYIGDRVSIPEVSVVPLDDIEADMAISFGGDGTYLVTSHTLARKNIPILGINAGHLGFLADVSISEIESVLLDVVEGRYTTESRVMLDVRFSDGTESARTVLNEVAVLRGDTCSMLTLDLYVDGEFVNSYKSDGLLVSTPTGSTAYSLSVGGPIVSPDSADFIISPIAPHSLTVRPLIVRDDRTIEIRMKSCAESYQIAVDGYSMHLPDSTSIRVKKSQYSITSIQPEGHTFFKTLRSKLMWGADTRL